MSLKERTGVREQRPMVIWINGAFGAGKTSVARRLAGRAPATLLFDPEQVGFLLCRLIPAHLRPPDFQDLLLWRQLVLQTAAGLIEQCRRPLIVPMKLTEPRYFDDIVGGLRRRGIEVHHFALLATKSTLRRRLFWRPATPASRRWTLAQADRCAAALEAPLFARHVRTDRRRLEDIVDEIQATLPVPLE